ncbi:MAG: DUF1552 domain-containing protein [Myxococcota bacterium]
MKISRRSLLQLAGAGALSWSALRPRRARASATAKRLIIYYFPDGVAGASQDGEPSEWHASGSETGFTLGHQLEPLRSHRDHCLFFSGLSMGQTDAGSHPGGAKKLLTGVDGGNGESIDQYVSRTVGANMPWRHLYLGAAANMNGASGDKHIVYTGPGQTLAPEDDPRRAYRAIFGGGVPSGPMPVDTAAEDKSVLDAAIGDIQDLKARLGGVESSKLDLHLEALRDVERRIMSMPMNPPPACGEPGSFMNGPPDSALYDPARFPEVLRMQMDLMVTAMACGITKVGTIQCSDHTSELIMSRFPGTSFSDPGFDMRSHQASHYGPRHDLGHREYRDYLEQRRWFVSQFAYLLDQLAARPEDGGTMLDHSLVLLCTEVCDGNTHSHDDMPFILGGGMGGVLRTGRRLDFGGTRHSNLLLSLARAMGDGATSFGEASSGGLPGILA